MPPSLDGRSAVRDNSGNPPAFRLRLEQKSSKVGEELLHGMKPHTVSWDRMRLGVAVEISVASSTCERSLISGEDPSWDVGSAARSAAGAAAVLINFRTGCLLKGPILRATAPKFIRNWGVICARSFFEF